MGLGCDQRLPEMNNCAEIITRLEKIDTDFNNLSRKQDKLMHEWRNSHQQLEDRFFEISEQIDTIHRLQLRMDSDLYKSLYAKTSQPPRQPTLSRFRPSSPPKSKKKRPENTGDTRKRVSLANTPETSDPDSPCASKNVSIVLAPSFPREKLPVTPLHLKIGRLFDIRGPKGKWCEGIITSVEVAEGKTRAACDPMFGVHLQHYGEEHDQFFKSIHHAKSRMAPLGTHTRHFDIGEAVKVNESGKWHMGTIQKIENGLMYIRWEHWNKHQDKWIDINSDAVQSLYTNASSSSSVSSSSVSSSSISSSSVSSSSVSSSSVSSSSVSSSSVSSSSVSSSSISSSSVSSSSVSSSSVSSSNSSSSKIQTAQQQQRKAKRRFANIVSTLPFVRPTRASKLPRTRSQARLKQGRAYCLL